MMNSRQKPPRGVSKGDVTNDWSQSDYDEWIFTSSSGFKTTDLREEAALALKFVKGGRQSQAIDVGARHGCYTRCLQIYGFSHIHAFEMVPDHAQGFFKNINLDNVTLYNVPLLERKRKIRAWGKSIDYSRTIFSTLKNIVFGTWAYSIDDYDIENVGFIKIDVDGPDSAILRGALETVRKWRPVIQMEAGHLQMMRNPDGPVANPEDLYLWFLKESDYKAFKLGEIDERTQQPRNVVLVPSEDAIAHVEQHNHLNL